jgi:hypothetical protein
MLHSLWRRFAWQRSGGGLFRDRSRRSLRARCFLPICEVLETRELPTAFFVPTYVAARHAGRAAPLATTGPTGYTPAQARHAYGFDQVWFGSTPGDGRGQTIAIVDAYDDPNIASDLHQFDLAFGLPDPVLTKVNQNGGFALPAVNTGWIPEISLDVEWAHAAAPGARILLVEANSNSNSDLFNAVTFAANQSGVSVVSLSWGGSEWSSESSVDHVFTTPAGHSGVTFVAAAGDNGAPPIYPAASPNVLAVGGTSLYLGAGNTWAGESAWSGGGGGLSAYEGQPWFQRGVVSQSSTRRTTPDVAYDANPSTGFSIYDSYGTPFGAPWLQYGGTSVATPQWAGLIAVADQGRAAAGLGTLDGPSQTLPAIYQLPSGDFHDITTGNSTGSPNYWAGPGYDLVTGRGSPIVNLVVGGLASYGTAAIAPPSSPWTNLNGTGNPVTAARNADGSQQVFTVGTDSGIWVRTQSANGSWSGGWQGLGGIAGQLAVTSNVWGYQDVFVTGSDHGVWMRSEIGPGQWTNWTGLGGSWKSITAGTTAGGTEQLFAVDGNKAIWTCTETAPGWWTGWTYLGGNCQSPTVTRNSRGLLDLFVIGSDSGLWMRSETALGQWTGWTGLGGACQSLTVGNSAFGGEQVFVVGSDNAMWTRTQTFSGQWTPWTGLGGACRAPVVSRNAWGYLDVFVVGSDGGVWSRSETAPGQWTGWTGLGGSAMSLAATTDSSGRLSIVTDSSSEALALRAQRGPGSW